jgi:hypothetical protein
MLAKLPFDRQAAWPRQGGLGSVPPAAAAKGAAAEGGTSGQRRRFEGDLGGGARGPADPR